MGQDHDIDIKQLVLDTTRNNAKVDRIKKSSETLKPTET